VYTNKSLFEFIDCQVIIVSLLRLQNVVYITKSRCYKKKGGGQHLKNKKNKQKGAT
jgi:hypothetical protein